MAPGGLRHRESFRPECVDRPVAIAPRIAFSRVPLPGSRRIGVRADIREERPIPDGIRPQGLVPRRTAARELLDRRLPLLSDQEVAQLAHVAKGKRNS